MDKSRFRFSSEIRVRNFEIDWQGVVHNAVYIQYFETGRIDYLKNLGVKVDTDAINRESKIVIVRSELDYKSPARFDDLLKVFTRISRIGNTSFTFEGIMENADTGQLIAESLAIHVWLDPETGKSKRVNEEFRLLVRKYEGENLELTNGTPKV
jgi:acyl-CoA thioester hydrolase